MQKKSKEVKSDNFCPHKLGRVKTLCRSNREKSNITIAIMEDFDIALSLFRYLGAPITFSPR